MAIVYLLKSQDEVVYVGMAKNISCAHNRVYCHERDKIFDFVDFIDCEPEGVEDIENNLILKYLPKYNKMARANSDFGSLSETRSAISELAGKFFECDNLITKIGNNGYIDLSKVHLNGFSDFATPQKIKEAVISIRNHKEYRKINAPLEREQRYKEIMEREQKNAD